MGELISYSSSVFGIRDTAIMALNSLAYLVGCCLTIASPTLGWWPRWRVFAGSQTELPHLSLSPYGANFYGVYFSVVERVELSRLLRVVDPHNILHSGTICRDGLAGGPWLGTCEKWCSCLGCCCRRHRPVSIPPVIEPALQRLPVTPTPAAFQRSALV